ncbi:MAG: S1C family serine protease [Anaerolineae bacterium]|nr:S1C family serine protease [Anaerolineae bacterium]
MSDVLRQLSDEMAGVVETTGAGVVRIEARRRLPASGIVWSADGVIVTAHHVVQDEERIQIGLPNGETVAATLVGRDPNTDVAVLRAQAELTAPKWGESDSLQVGHLVLALGRPGQNIQATLGVVSARGEAVMPRMPFMGMPPGMPPGMPGMPGEHRGRHGEHHGERGHRKGRRWGMEAWWGAPAAGNAAEGMIQTDVVMYPGFSGGPLVDASGQVRGMNTSGFMRGLSLTVPTAAIKRVVETLLQHGRMRRGFLGISAQPARLPQALAAELGQDTGLLLVSVEPGSPAENSGLLLGDVLVALDGVAVEHLDELLALLSGDRVGREVPVNLVRGGELREVRVTIGERM